MMKERALVAGGTFAIRSQTSQGTIITATFPRVWVEEGTLLKSFVQPTSGDGEAPVETTPQVHKQVHKKSKGLLGRFWRRGDSVAVMAGSTDPAPAGTTAGPSAKGTTSLPAASRSETDQDQRSDRDRRPVPA
jgi:hypothetical protein